MNLQHAVQHSQNVSLARLHTNKPVGTCGLTPTWLIFDIVLAHTIQEPKEHVYSHLRTLETLSSYFCQLRVLVLKCASALYEQ